MATSKYQMRQSQVGSGSQCLISMSGYQEEGFFNLNVKNEFITNLCSQKLNSIICLKLHSCNLLLKAFSVYNNHLI